MIIMTIKKEFIKKNDLINFNNYFNSFQTEMLKSSFIKINILKEYFY